MTAWHWGLTSWCVGIGCHGGVYVCGVWCFCLEWSPSESLCFWNDSFKFAARDVLGTVKVWKKSGSEKKNFTKAERKWKRNDTRSDPVTRFSSFQYNTGVEYVPHLETWIRDKKMTMTIYTYSPTAYWHASIIRLTLGIQFRLLWFYGWSGWVKFRIWVKSRVRERYKTVLDMYWWFWWGLDIAKPFAYTVLDNNKLETSFSRYFATPM